MSAALDAFYVETSAILRPVLEKGVSRQLEDQLDGARLLVTSRLSLVEASRALLRARRISQLSEVEFSSAERALDSLWARCEIWEITREICGLAAQVAPTKNLRTLDAIHLATYLTARKRIEDLGLMTADDRLREAAEG